MKSYIIGWMIALSVVIFGAQTTDAAPARVKGSGNYVDKEVTVAPFENIKASRGIRVTVIEGAQGKVQIKADDNIIEWVTAKVYDKTLQLGIDSEIRTLSNVRVEITVPSHGRLEELTVTSAAVIDCQVLLKNEEVELSASSAGQIATRLMAETCEIACSSAGKVKAEVKSKECEIEASSSGKVEATLAVQLCDVDGSSAANIDLEGAAIYCEVELSSAADLEASKLAVKEYDISCSSGADADILCLETLKAQASSGGAIRYSGSCKNITRKTSSGGSIR